MKKKIQIIVLVADTVKFFFNGLAKINDVEIPSETIKTEE